MRTHAEWNVITHIARARRPPTRAATRAAISPAALFVKVIARISPGAPSRSASREAIRWVTPRVFPEPAPATISRGPPAWVTAARCCGLSPSSRECVAVVVVVTVSSVGGTTVKGAFPGSLRHAKYHRNQQFSIIECPDLATIMTSYELLWLALTRNQQGDSSWDRAADPYDSGSTSWSPFR